MDRLDNITGRGAEGFPVSTEVIDVLHNYRLFIEAILGGFHLPHSSCVFLTYSQMDGSMGDTPEIKNAIAFIVSYNDTVYPRGALIPHGGGGLYRIADTTGFTVDDLARGVVQKSVRIITTPNDVVANVNGENGQGVGERVWTNVYRTVKAELVNPTGLLGYSPPYRFYLLRDLINITT